MKKKIGVLGGTFDPVHIVHMIIAENAYREYGLDEVILIPSGDPPHKTDRHVTKASFRMEMLEIAAKDVPYFRVSDMEIKRGGLSYTSDTLLQLKEEEPDADIYFIMGGDSLFMLEKWHEPATVMKNCIILATVRGDADINKHLDQAEYLKEKYGADILLMDLPALHISSSEIRQRSRRGQSIRFMVPETVDKYIEENSLYKKMFMEQRDL